VRSLAFDVQRSAFDVQRSAFDVQRSIFDVALNAPPHPGPLLRLRSEERETVHVSFKNNVKMHPRPGREDREGERNSGN
jgi:hypothetical protein